MIEYEEEWYKEQASPQLKGAAYTAQCEQALMQELDDEFKDELELWIFKLLNSTEKIQILTRWYQNPHGYAGDPLFGVIL